MIKAKELIFSITNRCNLKCRMCDIPTEKSAELTTEECKNTIADAFKCGFSTLVFSGGEPLLREDIFELIAFVKNNRMSACLTSNGCLIDPNVARQLRQAGVDVVNISIEGPDRVHDFLRGAESFNKAISGLKNLKEVGLETTIATVVTKYNYSYLSFIPELAKDLRVGTIRFQPFSDIFLKNGQGSDNFVVSSAEKLQVIDAIKNVIELSRRYQIYTNPESYLTKIGGYLSGEKVIPQGGCNALWSTCCINAQGDIFPCWVINEGNKLIGNLKAQRLSQLWESSRHRIIRQSVAEDGCPGCMMSCYDQIFDSREWKKNTFRKIGKLNDIKSIQRLKNRIIQNIKSDVFAIMHKYKFYKSYRGSLVKLLRRLLNKFVRRLSAEKPDGGRAIERSLAEIKLMKEKIQREVAKYK